MYFDPSGHTIGEFWECVKETVKDEYETWRIGAIDCLNYHRSGLVDIVRWTENKKGAVATSVSFNAQVGFYTYSGSVGAALDAKGNLALTKVNSVALSTATEESISPSLSVGAGYYHVGSVDELSGFGLDIGLSIMDWTPAVSLAMDDEQNITAWGVTVSQTVFPKSDDDGDSSSSSVGVVVQWDNTIVDTGLLNSHYNLYDYLDYLDGYLLEKLNA